MKLVLDEFIHENLLPGFTPYFIYRIFVDDQEVGTCVFRLGDDQEHEFDGHIAYTIEEPFRGHGYAYQACLLLKKKMKQEGYDHVIITCDPDNIASKKTILKLGGLYQGTKAVPAALKKFFTPEEKLKEIYIWEV
jgi:tagatose 1,6-diphosphate aldolase